MLCPRCGKEISESAKFCRFCGAKVAGEEVEANSRIMLNTNAEDARADNNTDHEKRPHKRRLVWVVVPLVIAIIAAAVILCLFLRSQGDAPHNENVLPAQTSTSNSTPPPPPAKELSTGQNVIAYENGDTVYSPTQDTIIYDEDENVLYYDDLLVVYLLSDISSDDAAALAESVNGTVVGDISGSVNVLQIRVNASDLTQLNNYADTLMASEDVLYATYDMPLPVTTDATADGNPWSNDLDNPQKDRANEDWPDGNDWWAEAIGAYTAWNYVDSGVELAPVTVGIIDDGFEDTHPEFDGRMTVRGSNEIDVDKNGSPSSHGTHVAGIIGAANNEQGIRGVADGADLICVDWSITAEDGSATNLLSTGEYIEGIKQQIEAGARVINNSWGFYLLSEKAAIDDIYAGGKYDPDVWHLIIDPLLPWKKAAADQAGLYEAYLNYAEKYSQRTAVQCILLNAELMLNQGESNRGDYIIVMAAGNGLDNGGRGVNAQYSGFFCGVSKGVFDMLPSEALSKAGITFESVKDHILIVGAVENRRGDKDGYYMTSYSNFGETVDICAPGGKYEEKDESSQIFSTVLGSQYGYSCGTSMAAPMVSGAAALLWSIEPNLSAKEVKNLLLNNSPSKAIGVGDDKGTEYPMLNIGAAIEALLKDKNIAVKPTEDKVLLAVNEYDENDTLVRRTQYEYEDALMIRSVSQTYGSFSNKTVFDYTYDEQGHLLNKHRHDVDQDYDVDTLVRSYDPEGKLLSESYFGFADMWTEVEYTYDQEGRVAYAVVKESYPDTAMTPIVNEFSCSYYEDPQGDLVAVRHCEKNPALVDAEFIYDEEGRMIQSYDDDKSAPVKYEYIDDPYFCVRDELMTADFGTGQPEDYFWRVAYILDSAGQEVESFWLGSSETAQMNYDEDGYLASVETSDQSGLGGGRTEFIYGEPGEEPEVPSPTPERETLPPLAYEMRTESNEYTAPDNSVTTSDLSYPYFTDDYPIAAMLNEKIEKDFAERRHSDTDSQGGSNEDQSEAIEDGQALSFIDNVEIMVTYNDDGLISLLCNSYVYGSGAAHGWKTCEGYIYDTSTCEQLDYRTLAGSKISQMNARFAQEASALGLSTGPSEAVAYALTDEGLCFYYEAGPTLPWDIVVVPFTSEYFDRAPIDNKTTDSESTGSILTQEEAYALAVAGSGFEDGETQTISGSEFVIQFWDCGRAGYNGRSVYVYQVRRLRKIEGPQMTQLMETVLVDAITGECIVISPVELLVLDDDPLSENIASGETSTSENESSTQEAHPTLTVTGNGVNIRSGPGTSYESIGSVNKGDILFSKGKSDNWYMVEYGNTTGYIIEDYVTIERGGFYTAVDSGTLSVNGADVNIRSGPGTEYQSIGSVSSGTTLTITGKSDNWYQVDYNGRKGYIIEDFVTRN